MNSARRDQLKQKRPTVAAARLRYAISKSGGYTIYNLRVFVECHVRYNYNCNMWSTYYSCNISIAFTTTMSVVLGHFLIKCQNEQEPKKQECTQTIRQTVAKKDKKC
eukprot:3289133-Amphidinium_carterae.1